VLSLRMVAAYFGKVTQRLARFVLGLLAILLGVAISLLTVQVIKVWIVLAMALVPQFENTALAIEYYLRDLLSVYWGWCARPIAKFLAPIVVIGSCLLIAYLIMEAVSYVTPWIVRRIMELL
jgi:hypothetical protein